MADRKIKSLLVELLKEGHPAEVLAYGISMYPLLRPGDKLVVHPVKPEIGDIAVFDRGDVLVAHRVYKIHNGVYFLKGDSLLREDAPIPQDKVLGTVIERRRGSKRMCTNSLNYKVLRQLMPQCTFMLGYLFHYYARFHQKLLRCLK